VRGRSPSHPGGGKRTTLRLVNTSTYRLDTTPQEEFWKFRSVHLVEKETSSTTWSLDISARKIN
jgi:hypothetical protein